MENVKKIVVCSTTGEHLVLEFSAGGVQITTTSPHGGEVEHERVKTLTSEATDCLRMIEQFDCICREEI